ncbi:RNA-directed DNA polymerase from transposon X-element [Zalerion maritima]|uniref:RNA-directed DNA polymerase from transposon X-element n=1 Tax=Zalerion maritima TaxID=339359 RepID=A0AAD5WR38_9PEZI|nr:RNA-directed DNA polymerase from transposon X-element [Zalerion maritima]
MRVEGYNDTPPDSSPPSDTSSTGGAQIEARNSATQNAETGHNPGRPPKSAASLANDKQTATPLPKGTKRRADNQDSTLEPAYEHGSSMDIDSTDPTTLHRTLGATPSHGSQRPRRNARKTNYNYENQRHRRPNRRNHIRIAQCNVGKVSPAHTAFLQLCWAEKIDIILVQEPWVSLEGRNFFNSHPGYDAYVPVDNWDDLDNRPRVITYVRKGDGLRALQKRPWATRDLLWVDQQNLLLNFTPPPNCIIGGDFNAWHSLWEPGVAQPRNQGNSIAKWAATHRLAYVGEAGVQTHASGHVLDLTFSNIPFATAEIADVLHPGTDHEGILIIIPSRGPLSCEQHRLSVPDDKLEAFAGLVAMGAASAPFPSAAPTAEELDGITERLTGILSTAIKTEALREFRRAKKQYQGENWTHLEARRDFLKVVRQEKRNYWQERIEDATSDKDLYKIIHWHKLSPAIKAPPLVVGGRPIDNPTEKAHALRTALLERYTDADDLDYDPLTAHIEPKNHLPWQSHLSEQELKAATIAVKSNSPGVDGVSVRLLKACWPGIKEHVRRLFQACMEIGYHLRPFRTAEVVMLRKPNKKDLTTPRSWRPIALLFCIGKGLERLVARRIASTALTHKVISPQQAGALPTRSATDLIACVTHEIEHSLENRHTATMMTLDVQGAFDATLRKRLMLRMLQQGWPTNLVRFVGSFMEERRARIRLEDTVTETQKISCGLPQGSPASPILFLLYIADIFLEDKIHRFGYADDVCVLRTGRSLEDNAEKLGQDLTQILSWGEEHKVAFDPGKCELMHFTRSRDTTLHPEVSANDFNFTIREQPVPAIRWLGVWFDRKLKFNHHVTKRTTQASIVAHHIRSLANTRRGPPPAALRKAVITCILPILTYGAEAWYAGTIKTRKILHKNKSRDVSTKQEHLIGEVAKVLNGAIRAVLPVWKTTPNETLYRDSGIPTEKIALEQARLRFGHRLLAVDKEHPLASRASRRPLPRGRGYGDLQPARTRLQRAAELLPEFPRPAFMPKQYPPDRGPPTGNKSKKEAAEAFEAWLEDLPDTHIVVYSDGSKSATGGVGWGYAIYQDRNKIAQGKGRLGTAEVFDGEAEGARHGLMRAYRAYPGCVIHVCLDNTAVIQGLTGEIPESSQDAFIAFQKLATTATVQVHWVPGHEGIKGNEEADRLAKEGAALPTDNTQKPTLAGVGRIARARINEQFTKWWEQKPAIRQRYDKLGFKSASLRCPIELSLPRPVLHHLLAMRTGHGDFEWYHRKLDHRNSTRCSCKRLKTPEHIVHCRKTTRLRDKWPKFKPAPKTPHEYWLRLISSPKDFEHFLQITQFYETICPQRPNGPLGNP